jgi:hypothetical protein
VLSCPSSRLLWYRFDWMEDWMALATVTSSIEVLVGR